MTRRKPASLVGRAVLYSSVFGSGGWRVGAARGPAVRWVCPPMGNKRSASGQASMSR